MILYTKERAFYNDYQKKLKGYSQNEYQDIKTLNTLIHQYGLVKYLDYKTRVDIEDTQNAINEIIVKRNLYKEREKSLKVILPILILIFSFIFVTWIGGKLQEDSFNRRVVFEKKLEKFQYAQKRVMEISFDLRDAYYRINDDIQINERSRRYDAFIREQRNQLEALGNILRLFPRKLEPILNKTLLTTIQDLDNFLSQREKNINLQNIDYLKEKVSMALIYYLENLEV